MLLGATTAVIAGLVALFYVLMWRQSGGPEWAVVPDHLPTTVVFLAAFLASAFVAHHAYTPDRPGRS
jgi:hypothetical protein